MSVGFAQVWYHVCPNRGKGCYNTKLKENGGCTIWYNEKEVRTHSIHLHDIKKIWTILILIVFHFSCCQKSRNIWNAPLLSVNLTSKYLWMNLMAKWLMGSAGLQGVSVSLRCPVCVLPFIVSVTYLCIYFLSHTPGGLYKGHVDILAPTVRELANLEREAQTSFLHLGYLPNQLFKAF